MVIVEKWKSDLLSYSHNYIQCQDISNSPEQYENEYMDIVSDETNFAISNVNQSPFDLSEIEEQMNEISRPERDIIFDFKTDYNKALELKDRVMFPYLEYTYTDKYLYELMEQLRNDDIDIDTSSKPKYSFHIADNELKFKGKYHNIVMGRNEYQYKNIKKYFNEKVIVNCRPSSDNKFQTLMEYFETNYEEIVNNFKKFGQTLTTIGANAYIYNNIPKVCSGFRPKVMKHLINVFGAKSVLDPSCGWGDRLIGCYSTNVEQYYGYDSNLNLAEGYRKLIEFYGTSSSYEGYNKVIEYKANDIDCNIEFIPFENSQPPSSHFDLAILCPPNYDKETYMTSSDDEIRYQSSFGLTERQWYDTKMKVWIDKCHQSLKVNGVLCVNLKSNSDTSYVKWFIDDMKRNRMWKSLETMNYQPDDKKEDNEPIFIWRKS
jgi:hypothetical protein